MLSLPLLRPRFPRRRLPPAALLAALLLVACGGDAISPVAALRLELDATPTAVSAGDTLQTVIRVINPGNRAVTISGDACLIGLEVRGTASDTVVQSGVAQACQRVFIERTIAAGDTLLFTGRWAVPADLPVGAYEAWGTLNAHEIRRRSPGVHLTVVRD